VIKVEIAGDAAEVVVTVFGYERESATKHDDANWLRCEVHVRVPGFSGAVSAAMVPGDFVRFADELRSALAAYPAEAKFDTYEKGLALAVMIRRTGTAYITGVVTDIETGSQLSFGFETEDTRLGAALKGLERVIGQFPVR
jgi:hypothetical protein